MASSVQILLSVICVALAEAQFNLPFFHIPGLQPLTGPNSDEDRNDQPINKNLDNNYDHESWQHHVEGLQRRPGPMDGNEYSNDRHHRRRTFEHYNPYVDGIRGQYFGGAYGMGNFNPMTGRRYHPMPGINNVFDIPNQGYTQRHQKPKNDNTIVVDGENPEENPSGVSPVDKKPTSTDKDPKSNDANNLGMNNPDINNNPGMNNNRDMNNNPGLNNNQEGLPPKTNKIKNNESPTDTGDKDKNQVDLNKKKDYLLVGSGTNGNNVYLLHENNANPNVVGIPNGNLPNNNVMYVPYNPGQSYNPAYQVINGQPASLPMNQQLSPDKMNVNGGYNNAIPNPGQSSVNLNSASQNPGYVLIYSNGHLIQIPGVVVNSGQNNVPLQNGNPVQGTNYVVANTVPNNMQHVPVIQNPGTNGIYTTGPIPGSNAPLYVQIPNCMHAIPNYSCGSGPVVQNPMQGVNNAANVMPNNGLAGNVAGNQQNPNMGTQTAGQLPKSVSTSYSPPNMVTNQGQNVPNQGAVLGNQNGPYQPAVEMPVNGGSNWNNQPMVSNQGQGPNIAGNAPNQGAMPNNQNGPYQPPVQMPVNSGSNWNNQPIVSNQGQGPNVPGTAPNQGAMPNNQNGPYQPAVQMRGKSGSNLNNQPMVSNQGEKPNVAGTETNQGGMLNNQNSPYQHAVEMPINSGTNAYNQQPNPGDQGNNGVLNIPTHDAVNQPGIEQPLTTPTNSLPNDVSDKNDMSLLGAQPAIMISSFKETSGDKKDKKKSKDSKEKKDKGEKKEKKNKDADKSKESEPKTNKIIPSSNLATVPK